MNLVLSAALVAAKTAVAKHLCVAETALQERLERYAVHLAQALGIELAEALKMLGNLTIRQLCDFLAEGPTEKVRAMMAPEQVHPVEHAGLSGHEEAGGQRPEVREEENNPANIAEPNREEEA